MIGKHFRMNVVFDTYDKIMKLIHNNKGSWK